jgi:hypothetical protein
MEINKHINIIQKSCDEFIADNLQNIIDHIQNNKILIDKDYKEFKVENIPSKSWGIYVFYIHPSETLEKYKALEYLWHTANGKLNSPKAIKGKFEKLEKDEPACFYVGKSEDLSKRISQHIHQKTNPSTYGLKISEHDKLHKDYKFSFSYYILKEKPSKEIKDAMKCLLVTLESNLRHQMKPLIGKQ